MALEIDQLCTKNKISHPILHYAIIHFLRDTKLQNYKKHQFKIGLLLLSKTYA
jgi:hypothetical protein